MSAKFSISPSSGNSGSTSITFTALQENTTSQEVTLGTVTFTSTEDSSKTLTVTVKQAAASTIAVTSIDVSPSTASVVEGNTVQLTATVYPVNASFSTVTWSSSDTSIATVNSSGLVTAVSTGSVIITATAGGLSDTCTVTVTSAVAGLVDLGLPSGTLWMDKNIGASSVEDTGDRFGWGESVTRAFVDDVYPNAGEHPGHSTMSSSSSGSESGSSNGVSSSPVSSGPIIDFGSSSGHSDDTTPPVIVDFQGYEPLTGRVNQYEKTGSQNGNVYVSVISKDIKAKMGIVEEAAYTVLSIGCTPFDPASVAYNNFALKMPSYDQWYELVTNCRITHDTVNSVDGYRFTSNITGYTSRSIFIPVNSTTTVSDSPYNRVNFMLLWKETFVDCTSFNMQNAVVNTSFPDGVGQSAYWGLNVRACTSGRQFDLSSDSIIASSSDNPWFPHWLNNSHTPELRAARYGTEAAHSVVADPDAEPQVEEDIKEFTTIYIPVYDQFNKGWFPSLSTTSYGNFSVQAATSVGGNVTTTAAGSVPTGGKFYGNGLLTYTATASAGQAVLSLLAESGSSTVYSTINVRTV